MEQIDRFFQPNSYYNDPRAKHPWMNAILNIPASVPRPTLYGGYQHQWQQSYPQSTYGKNPYDCSNIGYGTYCSGYQHQSSQTYSHYAYQPSKFATAFPNFSTDGVGFFSNNHMDSFYGTRMMETNCSSKDLHPSIALQHQGSHINHAMDGPVPIDFPVDKSENYSGTSNVYYGQQVTSSSHQVFALETPTVDTVIAYNRDDKAVELDEVDGLKGDGVNLDEIECSVPTSSVVANSKMNLPNPVHKLFDEMPTHDLEGHFDKLFLIYDNLVEAENLLDAEQLKRTRTADSEPNSRVFGIPEVLLEGKILGEPKVIKGEECTVLDTLLDPIISPPHSDELSVQNACADSACSFSFDVNESDSSSETIVIPEAQNSRATGGVTDRATDTITKSNEGNRKVILKLQEEFQRLENQFEVSWIGSSLPEDRQVVGQEEVFQLIPNKNGFGDEVGNAILTKDENEVGRGDEDIKRCKKVKRARAGRSKKAKKKKKKKNGLPDNFSSREKSSNSNKEENMITVNGDNSNSEVDKLIIMLDDVTQQYICTLWENDEMVIQEDAKLIETFREQVLKLNGEGEAPFGQLTREGHVDICIIVDDDSISFRARSIIKGTQPNSREAFVYYCMLEIESGLELRRKHMIAISLLVGNIHNLTVVAFEIEKSSLGDRVKILKGERIEDNIGERIEDNIYFDQFTCLYEGYTSHILKQYYARSCLIFNCVEPVIGILRWPIIFTEVVGLLIIGEGNLLADLINPKEYDDSIARTLGISRFMLIPSRFESCEFIQLHFMTYRTVFDPGRSIHELAPLLCVEDNIFFGSIVIYRSCLSCFSAPPHLLYTAEHTLMLTVTESEGVCVNHSMQEVVLITHIGFMVSHTVASAIKVMVLMVSKYSHEFSPLFFHLKIIGILDHFEVFADENFHKAYEVFLVQLSSRPLGSSFANEVLTRKQNHATPTVKKINIDLRTQDFIYNGCSQFSFDPGGINTLEDKGDFKEGDLIRNTFLHSSMLYSLVLIFCSISLAPYFTLVEDNIVISIVIGFLLYHV